MKSCNPKHHLDSKSIESAMNALSMGGVVAIPTETYYGLAVDAFNESAVKKLFTIKQRSFEKPILVLISDVDQLCLLTNEIPEIYLPLMEKFWPGALTLIFKTKSSISSLLTGGTHTIGVRISAHPFAQKLCQKWGKPITATSANISGSDPAMYSEQVVFAFSKGVDYIVEGGPTAAGFCSTVVSCDKDQLKLIRPGQVDFNKVLQAASKNK